MKNCNHQPTMKVAKQDAFYYDFPIYKAQVGCPLCGYALSSLQEGRTSAGAEEKAWSDYRNKLELPHDK